MDNCINYDTDKGISNSTDKGISNSTNMSISDSSDKHTNKVIDNGAENSLGIYVHIPFCKSKCYYCDFNSYSGKEYLIDSYFDALLTEIKSSSEALKRRPVRTIFIGGGTPSLVDPDYIKSLLEVLRSHFNVDQDAEISMESNPGTLAFSSLKAYWEAGVNRLSIGLQAWQDRLLAGMGRIHKREQFVENLGEAIKAGFRNINADLIFGLPGQAFDDWAETLEAVTSLCRNTAMNTATNYTSTGLTHLSCYSLKIEEGTVFGDRLAEGSLAAADDDLDRKMYAYTVELLTKKGYRHYEISNFAKPGFECNHNLIYWKDREYAGFGAGAHSYLNGKRFNNVESIEKYIHAVGYSIMSAKNTTQNSYAASLHENIESISRKEAMSEFMILGLRLIDGVSMEEFEQRFGMKMHEVYGEKLDKLVSEGLLIEVGEQVRLTALGLDLANKVFVEFI